MKKTFLLFIIALSVSMVSAQSSKTGYDSQQYRTSSIYSQEGLIENIAVYPNPVFEVLKISFKSTRKSVAVISIFNNIGKQVYTQETGIDPGNNLISIDIRSKAIEPGIYFIQCVAEKEVYNRKLIVK